MLLARFLSSSFPLIHILGEPHDLENAFMNNFFILSNSISVESLRIHALSNQYGEGFLDPTLYPVLVQGQALWMG